MQNASSPAPAVPRPGFPQLVDQAELDLDEMRRQMRFSLARAASASWAGWMRTDLRPEKDETAAIADPF